MNHLQIVVLPGGLSLLFGGLAFIPGIHTAVAILLVLIAGAFLIDAIARYSEARRFRRVWLSNLNIAYKQLWVRRMSKSWCTRNAAIFAVSEAEGRQSIIKRFHDRGYRWWHFLPEGAPRVFLSAKFWQRTFLGL